MAFFTHTLVSDTQLEAKPSLLARFFSAMLETRQRAAEREIARYIGLNGGKLTDSVELEIEKRFLPGMNRLGL